MVELVSGPDRGLAYSQAVLNKVACQLNERPRKTLGYETPTERFNACVASTGCAHRRSVAFRGPVQSVFVRYLRSSQFGVTTALPLQVGLLFIFMQCPRNMFAH